MRNEYKKNIHFIVAKELATLLDDKYEFLGIRFGLDPLLDLIPGLGDILTSLIGLYIVWVGKELGLPQDRVIKMIINVIIDFVINLIPVAGNVGTIFFRSNRMNMRIIEDYLRSEDGVVEEGQIVG